MSNRELCYRMIDSFPEDQLISVVSILENLCNMTGVQMPRPNAETRAAMDEINEMIRTGGGEHYEGSTEEFFDLLSKEK